MNHFAQCVYRSQDDSADAQLAQAETNDRPKESRLRGAANVYLVSVPLKSDVILAWACIAVVWNLPAMLPSSDSLN